MANHPPSTPTVPYPFKTEHISPDNDFFASDPPVQPVQQRLLPTTSEQRKRFPMARGLLDYFPDALAAVAEVSWIGNEKHNPGEPLHWARGKSMDHDDCIIRHTVERGGFEEVKVNGVTYHIRHSAARAWRSLAALQEELEAYHSLPSPRGAKDAAV